FFIISSIAVQTPGSGISNLLAVGTTFTGSKNLYCQWELSPGSGNALCILFPTKTTYLEVAFRQHTCFIRNLEGVDLLTGSLGNNLYNLSLKDMMASSLICLLSKASKTKSWIWHRRLSHFNFGAINHLARQGLVRGLPKLKFEKDHLFSACAMGKSTKITHKRKSKDTNQEKLYLLHMDLCGPMRVKSGNGKKYILVIVDDYSRFTWVNFLGSKDETPMFIIKFLKMIQQNGFIEICNRTLIEATRTMLIYAQAPLFLWAEAVATACFTQNRSIIRLRHEKTSYELLHTKLPDLSFSHVFGTLCYPTNDSENLAHIGNDPLLGVPILEVTSEQSSSTASPQSNVQPNHPMTHHNIKWTKDHPLNNIIGQLSKPVSIQLQLHGQALFCYYDAFLTSVEPKTYKEALTQA
nr:ribonuclease H-like domain-containing protein [Tanacetum cinerariifolium]